MVGTGLKAKGTEAAAAVPRGSRDVAEAWPALAGFGALVLPMAAVAAMLMTQSLPAPLVPGDAPPAPVADPLPLHYVDLPDPLTVAVEPDKPHVEMSLALVVRGRLEDLVPLKDRVMVKADVVYAAMLQQAQDLVIEGVEGVELHGALPDRLRGAINLRIGTPDWPEPVEEVLITSLVVVK